MLHSEDAMVRLRNVEEDDADAIGRLHALSWRTAYRGILSDEYLDKFAEADRLIDWRARLSDRADGTWVRAAVESEQIIGFVCVVLDSDDQWGTLLDNLHVSPELKGRGLGRRLMGEAVTWVLERRPSSPMFLWVYEANRPARMFYERFGGLSVERVVQPAADGHDLPFHRYAWKDLPKLQKELALQ